MSAPFIFDAANEAETARLGVAALAEVLPERCVVALNGTLGAGKTRLVQALATAAGVEEKQVVSPTFVLVQEYHGRRTIYHVDAYRLRDEDEFLALGVEEYFRQPALVLIEWAERVAGCLPRQHIEISIDVTSGDSRRFTIAAHGTEFDGVVEKLGERLARG